jgi:Zn-dependent protease with chaperone function
MTSAVRPTTGRIASDRWPTEVPLFVAVLVVAVCVWILLIVSVVGILYAVLLGLFFFFSHLIFVSHIRGSGVRIGPDQFPDLHRRIKDLAHAMGMDEPAAYLIQAGGSLNAFATRFLGRNIMVLHSDLLEACGDNEGARDMIIAHELAHLRLGHLRWNWLILPGYVVPLLGSALSRAREYTCDRYGLAGAGGAPGATLGLAILSAGPKFGPRVNLGAFVDQRGDTNTGLMTLGEWFSTHPALSKRVAALDPSLGEVRYSATKGRLLAAASIILFLTGSVVLVAGAVAMGSSLRDTLRQASGRAAAGGPATAELADLQAQVAQDFFVISSFIEQEWAASTLPGSMYDVRERWLARLADEAFPSDPYGYDYGYDRDGSAYTLWSSGSDGVPGTPDDLSVRIDPGGGAAPQQSLFGR